MNAIEQIPILDLLNLAALGSGEFNLVTTGYELKHPVLQSELGRWDAETLAAFEQLVVWQQSIGHYDAAEERVERTLSLAEQAELSGKKMAILQNLLAKNQYLRGHCCDDDLTMAARNNILQDESADFLERQNAELMKADFDVMAGRKPFVSSDVNTANSQLIGLSRYDRVTRAYESVFSELSLIPGQSGAVQGAPLPFCSAALSQLSGEEVYEIEAELSISAKGRLQKIRVLSSSVPKKVERLFKKIASVARYRPKFENGRAVDSTLILTQDFSIQAQENSQYLPDYVAGIHACHRVAQSFTNYPRVAGIQ